MESFEYLTTNPDYLDTFSFVSSNMEEQDQFMQCLDEMSASNNSSSSSSGDGNRSSDDNGSSSPSFMGLMIANPGNSVHHLKSAIDNLQAQNAMTAEEEIMRFESTLHQGDSLDDMMSSQFSHDDIVSTHRDLSADLEHRMDKLLEQEKKQIIPQKQQSAPHSAPSPLQDKPTDSPQMQQQQPSRQGKKRQRSSEGTPPKKGNRDNTGDSDNDNDRSDKEGRGENNGNGGKDQGENEETLSEEYLKERAWKVLSNIKDQKDREVGDKVVIEIKTRSDKAQNVLPDRLYSSLKYEFRQTVSLGLRMTDTGVMMCKMEIVDPDNPSVELLNANGERLVRGIQDFTAITVNKKNTCLEVKSKFQFTGVSYHHDKKFFAMKLSYFDPSYDMSAPVFSMISAPFQVFARRPTQKPGSGATGIRRVSSSSGLPRISSTCSLSSTVADSSDEEEAAPPAPQKRTLVSRKKKKTTKATRSARRPSLSVEIPEATKGTVQPSKAKRQKTSVDESKSTDFPAIESSPGSALANFFNCLELLIGFKQSLRSEEQSLALEIAHTRLFPGEQSTNDQRSPLPHDLLAEHVQESNVSGSTSTGSSGNCSDSSIFFSS